MANQITLGATLLFDGGDGTGGAPDDLTGAAAGTTDTSTFLEGSTSYTYSASNSLSGFLYDAGSAQNWANNTFYVTVNSGVVGLLSTFRIRFCGATVTDFFEVQVYGGAGQVWPNSIQGGWVTFVVDIEEAKADAGRITGGTEPATNAIRYVGFSQNLSTMPKMADNTWLDTIYRLPSGTAAIIVEGRNGGTTDWNAADILTQLGSGQMFYYQGAGGSYVLQGPIQFGINDTTTHGFDDTNAVWLWADQQYVADGSYGLSALGNSGGTTNVRLGNVTGTGNDAVGSQGFVISADPNGARWAMDFDDPNLDVIDFGGCSFIHGGTFQLDDAAVRVVSSLYIDCSQAVVSNSDQVRNGIVSANTADGVGFMQTDDMGDIAFCSFEFSDGHAIDITSAVVSTQNNVGNTFSGYTNSTDSTDAAIYLSAAGNPNLTISSSDGSDLQTNSWRTAGTGTITINNNVSVTFSGLIANTEVRVYATSGGAELAGVEDSSTTFVASIAAGTNVYYTIHKEDYEHIRVENFTWPSSATTLPIQQRFDANYVNN